VQDLKAIRFMPGTKVSHDYAGNKVTTFSYRELIELNSPAIGIPCRQNGLIVVDVDVAGATHKNDGREFWLNFVQSNGIPQTYTVRTPSGGFHFYFKLPTSVNPETLLVPAGLAPGVDIKWNGWVGAPPTPGYDIFYGNVTTIEVAPPSLLAYMASLCNGKETKTFDANTPSLELHRPFSQAQLDDLRNKIEWMQVNGTLSRSEWRDGLFALKAGVDDPALLDEFVCKWTMNRAYVPGDEEAARSMVARADKHGGVGPGTIFSIINQVKLREGAPVAETPFTIQEILDKSRVQATFAKDGSLKIEASESNAAAIIGAIFDDQTLYYDVRQNFYIYKNKPYSDTDLVNQFLPVIQSPAYGLGLEKFRKSAIAGGLDVLMAARQKDPHIAYLKSLKWDGTPRIEKFFVEYVGAQDCEYIRRVGKNFWTSLAARGMDPGCKFDSMVVLEGHEGIAKSSLVQAIGGEYTYAPSRKDSLENLDALRAMHQSVIVELPELIGMIGMDSETIKAFLSKPFDNIRAMWARQATKNNRGFVFIGTTNSDKYLSSAMGSRRFWPVRIPKTSKSIKLNAIKTDRDQLFAEAIHLYKSGHPYWEMPSNLLDPIVETRVVNEALIFPIREMIPTLGNEWTTTDVYRRLESNGYIPRGLTNAVHSRIESALKRLNCEEIDGKWTTKESVTSTLVAALQQVALTLDSLV
jgi:hypothetical protein